VPEKKTGDWPLGGTTAPKRRIAPTVAAASPAMTTTCARVATAQIQAVARKYLRDDNYARVRLLPGGTR